ncbi:hypothetical protein EBX93_18330, partial [bacterium]|nr:hypothetical protein [bacterium]
DVNYLYNNETTTSFLVGKATTIITNFTIPNKTFGDDPFDIIDPSSNNPGMFSYVSLEPSFATVSGNKITIVGAKDIVSIKVIQQETAFYLSNESIATFAIDKAIPTLTCQQPLVTTYGDVPFSLDISSNSSGQYLFESLTKTLVDISENVNLVTILGAGSNATINITQQETDNFYSRTISVSFNINKAIPLLSGFNIPTKTYGNVPFIIVPPVTNSNGSFLYSSSNLSVANISGDTITINGTGTTDITATQQETDNYLSNTIVATFNVNKLTPTLYSWKELSTKIEGLSSNDESGYSVSLSDDGTIVAVGSINGSNNNNEMTGIVKVYKLLNNNWSQLGNTIYGENERDKFGWSVKISSDGTTVVVGSPN